MEEEGGESTVSPFRFQTDVAMVVAMATAGAFALYSQFAVAGDALGHNANALPQQNALQPAGIQAAHIAKLWNLSLIVCGGVSCYWRRSSH
jgi:hypothetical protein